MPKSENRVSFREKLFGSLKDKKNILITSHMDPDDDSISSVMSLYHILSKRFPKKRIDIYYSGPIGNRWKNFKLYKKINSVKDIYHIINRYDALFCMDCNYFQRISSSPYLIERSDVFKICIDHHTSAPDAFDLPLIRPEASSTAQLIYEHLADADKAAGSGLAESLLLGILGDTGKLKYVNAGNSQVFEIVSSLVRSCKIDMDAFISSYSSYSKRSFQVVQELVANTEFKKIGSWPEFNYSYISPEFIKNRRITILKIMEGTHIFIEYFTTSLRDASWGLVAYPQLQNKIRVSLRSRPEGPNVRQIVERMNIGSGHDRSSGGTIKLENNHESAQDALKILFKWMRSNKP